MRTADGGHRLALTGIPAGAAARAPHAAPYAAALQYWGAPIPPGLGERAAPPRQWLAAGRPPARWVYHADRHGLWLSLRPSTPGELRSLIARGIPPLILRTPPPDPDGWPASLSMMLLTGVDRTRREWSALTARGLATSLPHERLTNQWHRAGAPLLLLCPPRAAPAPLTERDLLTRGDHYARRGLWAEAMADWRPLLHAHPGDASLLTRLGNAHRALGRPRRAEQHYREALAADDRHAPAYNALAYLLTETGGRGEEAIRLARQAVALDPTRAASLDTLGVALLARGKPEEAVRILNRAAARAKDLPPDQRALITLHLARALQARGRPHLAREALLDALGFGAPLSLSPALVSLLPPNYPAFP